MNAVSNPLSRFFHLVLLAAAIPALAAVEFVVTVDPMVRFQTVHAWEVTGQIGLYDETGNGRPPGYDSYQPAVIAATADYGVNRIRLELRSGSEHPIDYLQPVIDGTGTWLDWRNHWYDVVDDNAASGDPPDPFSIDPAGFQFTEIDDIISQIILPLRQHLAARGEQLQVNLCYVDIGGNSNWHDDHPEEYAEFIQAAFRHIDATWGFVPDALEIVLEPDNANGMKGHEIGPCLMAAVQRLQSDGYTPDIIAPSTSAAGSCVTWVDAMLASDPAVAGALHTISYHLYSGNTPAVRDAIAAKAAELGVETAMLEHIGSSVDDLFDDLTRTQVTAWSQYSLAWPFTAATRISDSSYRSAGSLFNIDIDDPAAPVVHIHEPSRHLRHVYRFVRSGAERIASTGDAESVAFTNPDGGTTVVILTERDADCRIDGLPAGTYSAIWSARSDTSPYWQEMTEQTITAGEALTIPVNKAAVLSVFRAGTGEPPSQPVRSIRIESNATDAISPPQIDGDPDNVPQSDGNGHLFNGLHPFTPYRLYWTAGLSG